MNRPMKRLMKRLTTSSICRWNCAALCIAAALTACGGSTTTPPSADAVNGCASADYVNGSSVTFQYPTYTPRCLAIKAGQTVTFNGDFSGHPFAPGVAASSTGTGSAGSPITATKTGTSAVFTFPAAGVYPYHCEYHSGNGMFGAVRVE